MFLKPAQQRVFFRQKANSEDIWERSHVGDAVIKSKDGRSYMKLRLYGLEHPEAPLENCWIKIATSKIFREDAKLVADFIKSSR